MVFSNIFFVLDTGHARGAWHPVLAAGESFLML